MYLIPLAMNIGHCLTNTCLRILNLMREVVNQTNSFFLKNFKTVKLRPMLIGLVNLLLHIEVIRTILRLTIDEIIMTVIKTVIGGGETVKGIVHMVTGLQKNMVSL